MKEMGRMETRERDERRHGETEKECVKREARQDMKRKQKGDETGKGDWTEEERNEFKERQ